ncbi:MAG TPA: PAS domain S-box protein [Gemmatimonadales bacterium]|nr:PAS domain S-box protein [Gemmatimonadales bacterium]
MRTAAVRWGLAVVMVGVSLLLNLGILALTGGPGRYVPIFPALILVTLLAGRGPGILHLVLTLLAIDYLWVPPFGRFWPIEQSAHALALLALALASSATIAVSDVARRALANHRRTQRDLDLARARLDVLHDAARLVEWEWDLASGRVQMSPSARSVFGSTWNDAGNSWPLAHPDDRARIEATVAAAVARGEDYAFTSRMIRPDTGETRWIETRAVVHRAPAGAPTHVTGVTIDVTEKEAALEAARVAEQRFQLALEGSSIVAWACDAQRRYTWVHNPPAAMSPADVIGQPVGRLRPGDQYDEYAEALDRVWRTGVGERLPISWTHDGDTRYFLASIEPVKDACGALTGLVGASVDVTELRRAEARVRLSEEKFAKAFWASPDGLSITRVEDGLLYEVNPSYLAIMGLTREEAIGRSSLDLGLYLDPADRQRGIERLRREGRLRDHEIRVRNRAGEIRLLRVSAEMIEVGGEAAMLTIHRDVTEQQRIDAALRDSEERLRLALEGAQIGMWVTDLATGRTECTPYNNEVFGFDPQSPPLPAEAWYQAVHPEDRPLVQAAWLSAIEHDTPYAVEYRIVRADGALRWIASRARFHRDGAGVPARALGISMDVTAQKAAEDALRESGRSKDEFLATLAHELRNPLAPLRTAAYLLNSPALGDGARRDAQQMIERQVTHLTRLVDDLLEVSRVTLGRIELLRERMSVAMVVEHAVEAARAAIEEGGHQLQLELPESPLWVDADLVRLSQVFTNLLTNAARYTPPGGRITVRAYAKGRDVIVGIRDTGIGIAPEMLGHVFEMFVQLPHGDRARHGGLGIGLALSKRLVELHGGSIEARSPGEGRGSEFSVCLPGVDAPRAAPAPARRALAAGGRRRILVVDDNVDAAMSLAILLELLGHEVDTVHDGHHALALLETETFDVVLLDIGMPTLSGYEVARRVRERLGSRAPKLVALTGWGQSDDRARSAEAGFDHHLLKPADPGVIAQVIETLAGRADGR